MRSTVIWRVALSLWASACTSSPPLSLPPAACGILVSHYGSFDCDPPNRQQFDLRGIWEYQECSYTATSANYQSQLGLSCSGRLALCGDARTSELTWQDVGPNGTGIGYEQHVELSSAELSDGQRQATVFGQTAVSDAQMTCTAPGEVVLGCVLSGDTSATCFKLSAKTTNACGVPPGWVISSFGFKRIGECR